MIKRRIAAVLLAAFVLAGCETTGAAPTPQPGFTNPPTTGAATTQQPAQAGTAYPLNTAPATDPNAVQAYPSPGTSNQNPATSNQAYPSPDSGSGERPTTAPVATPKP